MATPKKVKLSKKELKQPDEFQSQGERIVAQISENKKTIQLVFGALVLVGVIALGVNAFLSSQADKVSQAFAKAMEVYEAPVMTDEEYQQADARYRPKTYFPTEEEKYTKSLSAFDEFLKGNAGSNLGLLAMLHRGNCHFHLGNLDKAASDYQAFLQKGALGDFSFLAHQNLGQVYDAKGEFDKALAEFQKLVDEKDSPLKEQGAFFVAHIYYRKGDKEKAKEALEKFIENYPESSLKSKAEKRLESLTSSQS